jgi:hypothetical protein
MAMELVKEASALDLNFARTVWMKEQVNFAHFAHLWRLGLKMEKILLQWGMEERTYKWRHKDYHEGLIGNVDFRVTRSPSGRDKEEPEVEAVDPCP